MENTVLFNFTENETSRLKKFTIHALVLFGSQAQGLADKRSDFDIGVILGDQKSLYDTDQRKKIYDFLYDVLSDKIKELKNIDIVFLDTAPEELKSHVLKYGKVIFEFRPGVFADFKAKIMEEYADFTPLRQIFQKGIFSQIR